MAYSELKPFENHMNAELWENCLTRIETSNTSTQICGRIF